VSFHECQVPFISTPTGGTCSCLGPRASPSAHLLVSSSMALLGGGQVVLTLKTRHPAGLNLPMPGHLPSSPPPVSFPGPQWKFGQTSTTGPLKRGPSASSL